VPKNSGATVAEKVEKVVLPFDEGNDNASGSGVATDGAFALSSVDSAVAAATARLADHAQAWGITIPMDFTPATKAVRLRISHPDPLRTG
jgi:hypothetical protein